MGKFKEIKGYLRWTLVKLQSIKSDIVRTDDRWHDGIIHRFWRDNKRTFKVGRSYPVKSDPKHDQ